MTIELNTETIAAKLAGVAGAFVSMRFLKGGMFERLLMAVSGAIVSYFVAPYISMKTGLPESLSGFMLGLFGMAVVSRIWEWIQTTPIAETWKIFLKWLSNRAGVSEDRSTKPAALEDKK